jgi:hypothetical protein
MTLGHLALLLTLITLSFPNCAAEIFLAKPIGQRACEHLRDVTSTEMAVRRFQKAIPETVVVERALIASTGQRFVALEFPGPEPAVVFEGTQKECDSFLAKVRGGLTSKEEKKHSLEVKTTPDRVVKGWGGDKGWQWTDPAMREYDGAWRSVNLGAPVDCTPLSLDGARTLERGFVGQVAHLQEDGLPIVFMVRDKVQVMFMPIDLQGCKRKAEQIRANRY